MPRHPVLFSSASHRYIWAVCHAQSGDHSLNAGICIMDGSATRTNRFGHLEKLPTELNTGQGGSMPLLTVPCCTGASISNSLSCWVKNFDGSTCINPPSCGSGPEEIPNYCSTYTLVYRAIPNQPIGIWVGVAPVGNFKYIVILQCNPYTRQWILWILRWGGARYFFTKQIISPMCSASPNSCNPANHFDTGKISCNLPVGTYPGAAGMIRIMDNSSCDCRTFNPFA
jgi:hypothetical protein